MGTEPTGDGRSTADDGPAPERSHRRRGQHARIHHANTIRRASFWMVGIAVLQILAGLILGSKARDEAARALDEIAVMDDDEVVHVGGDEVRVAELRQRVKRQRLQAYAIPIGLGVVFLALFVWAQRAPVPAFGTALALWVTAHGVSAALDPDTITRGVILKVACFLGLLGGLKSALAQAAGTRHAAAAR